MKGFKIINSFIEIVFNIVVILLGLRFVLKLFGANPISPFVTWVYNSTGELLSPFRGIFISPTVENGFVLELSTLFAIIIYLLVWYLIQWLFTVIRDTIKSNKN